MVSKKKEKSPTQRPKTCVGELCWNPETERLEFEINTKKCPVEIQDKLRAKAKMVMKMVEKEE